jgi:hydroxymethylpyrimidine/phosphomethylpyrimidine kinase
MNKQAQEKTSTEGALPSTRPVAWTVAGFDPSAGAGVTADLKVFAAYGLYGMACITALTVQSTLGVRRVEPIAAETVGETLVCLREDVAPAGVKIGMLATAVVVGEVAAFLAERGIDRRRVVLDPVLRSSSGRELLSADGVARLRGELLGRVGWITPNLDELGVIVESGPLGREAVPTAAARLQELARRVGNPELHVVVTGGDFDRPDDFLRTPDGNELWLPGERVETSSTHGTGCAFSSALLCELIKGAAPAEAAAGAKAYVTEALRSAYPVGQGKGPMHHLFRLDS